PIVYSTQHDACQDLAERAKATSKARFSALTSAEEGEEGQAAEKEVYVYRCGVQRRMEPNTGYTNLLGNVFMWHTNFAAEMTSASTSTGTLVGFIDDKTHKVFSWIDMVLSCNLPFSFCETSAASNYVMIGGLSTDSL
ncbi:hypothetical protein F441_06986, partial [Phytophthora nicotianae CJ01A1]